MLVIDAALLLRVCNGVASVQEGQRLFDEVNALLARCQSSESKLSTLTKAAVRVANDLKEASKWRDQLYLDSAGADLLAEQLRSAMVVENRVPIGACGATFTSGTFDGCVCGRPANHAGAHVSIGSYGSPAELEAALPDSFR